MIQQAKSDGPLRHVATTRATAKALILANEFLGAQIAELQATAVSNGNARGEFELPPHDRKNWYD